MRFREFDIMKFPSYVIFGILVVGQGAVSFNFYLKGWMDQV